MRTKTPHRNTPSVHHVPPTTTPPPPELIRPPLSSALLYQTLFPSTQPWRPRPSTRCRSTGSTTCPLPTRGPTAPVPPRKHGGSGGIRARTRPSARTAHRAKGAGRDGGLTGVAARAAGDGGWRVEYLKGALSHSFLAPALSPNFLASHCPSTPLGVLLPPFHIGPKPSARASASLPSGGRWRTKTPAPLLRARTHRKGTPQHDTGGAPTAASCTWANMMTSKDGGAPAGAWLQLLFYLLCIFTLALVCALPTRDPRMDPIAHTIKVNATLSAVFGE